MRAVSTSTSLSRTIDRRQHKTAPHRWDAIGPTPPPPVSVPPCEPRDLDAREARAAGAKAGRVGRSESAQRRARSSSPMLWRSSHQQVFPLQHNGFQPSSIDGHSPGRPTATVKVAAIYSRDYAQDRRGGRRGGSDLLDGRVPQHDPHDLLAKVDLGRRAHAMSLDLKHTTQAPALVVDPIPGGEARYLGAGELIAQR